MVADVAKCHEQWLDCVRQRAVGHIQRRKLRKQRHIAQLTTVDNRSQIRSQVKLKLLKIKNIGTSPQMVSLLFT